VSPGAALRRAELLGQFAAARDRIEEAARAAERADATPPGEWTPGQVIRHLIVVESQVFQARLEDLETKVDPHWSWIEPGTTDAPEGEDLDGALARFADRREATLRRVSALDEAGWLRTGTHATYGVLDVGGLLRLAYDHDLDHLASLEQLADADVR
jgi:DinB family protein